MNHEQAAFTAHMFTDGLEREYEITRRVLAAVPEGKKDYRPDENARTAFALASHIASSDVWFLQGIEKGEFIPRCSKKGQSASARKARQDYSGVRYVRIACRGLSRISKQPLHTSSRTARHLSAPDGIQGTQHLRRQLRRAHANARHRQLKFRSVWGEPTPRPGRQNIFVESSSAISASAWQ